MKQITHDEMERVLDAAFVAAGLADGAEQYAARLRQQDVRAGRLVAKPAHEGRPKLSKRMKQILGVMMQRGGPISGGEIAKRLGTTANNVKVTIHNQRDRLPAHGVRLISDQFYGYWLERTK